MQMIGFWWPNLPQDCSWEVPEQYLEGPVITLLGMHRLASPTPELQEEIINCYYQFEERYEEYDEIYGTQWIMKCYDRVRLNGTDFHTHSLDTKRLRKRSVILVRWKDAADQDRSSFGVIRKIIHLRPFPEVETVINGVYLRLFWYTEISRFSDGIVVCSLDTNVSEIFPLHSCYPTNFLVINQGDDRDIIIDMEKQFQ